MDETTYTFTDINDALSDIQMRMIDALIRAREEEADGLLVSVFLPQGQCHLLAERHAAEEHLFSLTIVTDRPEGAEVTTRLTRIELEPTVRYIKHVAKTFESRRSVSNLVVTTDSRRIEDVTARLELDADSAQPA
jgi:hypothetical protein